ncbi:protein ERGIC-53 isoform X1 [Salvelinus fontinalis]|uniref:protein ERGIC-53 isoform X1 n=1 Tax=Salvelinus fontinalis TaxID=8038 RepID=UPI002486C7EA|nr:protein ERGIC-53 isoform X1 [Salvelinus fontinalis]
MLRQQWYQKMAVSIVNRLAADACLLILTLIFHHSNANNIAAAASTAAAPNRRFEYKYSFKGPHLSQPDGSIPFWVHSGNAIPSADQVRITPSLRSQKGSVWTKTTVNFDNWEAEVTFRVSGRGRMGADGLAIWFTTAQGLDGPVYGAADNWNGIGIFFDSFDNDGKKNNPAVLVVGNNGKLVYDHPNDGTTQALGTCLRDFRNKPYPVRAKITYYKRTLIVLINNGFTPDKDDYEFCTKVDNMVIPQEGYFGISAATGGLAGGYLDDHDVLSFLTFRLSEPGQELPPPEAEMPKQDKDKYQEEFENFQQDLDKKKEDYQKEHPEVQGQPIEDMYESVNDREIRQVFEGQNRIHLEIKQLHHQLAVILDEQRRYVSVATDEISKRQGESGGHVGQAPSQEMGVVVATQQEVLRNLNELRNSFYESLKQIGASQHQGNAVGMGTYETVQHFNDIKEHLHVVKKNIEHLITRNGNPSEKQVMNCPDPPPMPSCLGTTHFLVFVVIQSVLFFSYIMYKSQQEAAAKKFF